MNRVKSGCWQAGATLFLSLAACSAADNSTSATSDIVLGKPASGHTEAVLVDMMQNGAVVSMCSGAMISPYVVLTAGHCVDGFEGWTVTAPFAGGQQARSTTGLTMDYKNPTQADFVRIHDVGLIILSTPIQLDAYPKLGGPVADETPVINFGRVKDGVASTTTLYQGMPVEIYDATPQGMPNDYYSADMVQHGDSGGPVELAGGAKPPTIVAVNSSIFDLQTDNQFNAGYAFFTRVDLVAPWIAQQIAAYPNGAPLAAPATDAGAPDAGGMDGGGADAGLEIDASQPVVDAGPG